MDSDRDSESESKPDMSESEYEDLVWLTKKEVRSKLEKWRKEPQDSGAPKETIPKEDVKKTCTTCYFGTYSREVNKIWYVRCTLNEPSWRVVEDNLQCWKAKDR